jgi:asparagine synthase (glutamine-hydrolysing)
MCGIAGFTHLHSRPDPAILLAARESIRPRGPDQQGSHIGVAASLAAVRLKILDLGGGDQPIYSPDRDTVIVFNGEIYNFRALRAELESCGHRFESDCDTEVVLKAFLQWDTDSFAKLHGMFAVALWTESTRRLVLARDRMGIKPLYLARRGTDLHFGSELKAILAHPDIERNIDPDALSYFLSLNYIPHPHTLIEGVRKLEPGAWLEWQNGRERTERYWQLLFRPNEALTIEDAKHELDFLLDRAVREHLVSDVPLGIWLSGGLDSSAITHYASKHFAGRLKTFSVSFQGRSFDESPYFREVARAYDTGHQELDLAPDLDLASAIESIAHFADEPSADAGALPVWFLSGMTRQHVTVALSGEGADELFGGYKTYEADAYARWLRLVPAPLRRGALGAARALLPVSDEKISFEYKVKRFLEGSLLEPVEAHLFWNGVCSREQTRALLGRPNPANAADLFRHVTGGALNRFLAIDQQLYLVEDILYKCDRMSMAHSLEVRPPFLDHRIAEFAATLPERFKQGKHVLRELMRDKLPPAVTSRSKEGFDIPAHDWFRTRLKALLLDTVHERAVRESGLMLQWPAVRRLMDDHFARRTNAGYHLWGLLTLFLWAKRWGPSAALLPARSATATVN